MGSLQRAAAGLVDPDLSFLSLLKLYGTEIAERRMPTRLVVEALGVVEHEIVTVKRAACGSKVVG